MTALRYWGYLKNLRAIFRLQIFAASILGQLSDIYGRKRLLALSLAGTCISYIIFSLGILTRKIPLLFFARALDGITGGNISIAQASVADITPPKDRAKNLGLIGAAFGLGFILGPFLGGKLSDPQVVSWFNAATPFWFAAILSFANVLSVIFVFPETLKTKIEKQSIRWVKSIENILKGFRMIEFRALFGSTFLYQGGFSFYTTFASVFLIDRYMFSQGNIGDFFAYSGLWVIITQAVLVRKLSKRFADYQILGYSFFLMGIALLTYLLTRSWWQLLFLSPFVAMGNGLSLAFLNSLISRKAAPEIQGEILGINSSVAALSQSIPPILSGLLAEKISYLAPLVVAGLVIISAGILFRTFFRQPEPRMI